MLHAMRLGEITIRHRGWITHRPPFALGEKLKFDPAAVAPFIASRRTR